MQTHSLHVLHDNNYPSSTPYEIHMYFKDGNVHINSRMPSGYLGAQPRNNTNAAEHPGVAPQTIQAQVAPVSTYSPMSDVDAQVEGTERPCGHITHTHTYQPVFSSDNLIIQLHGQDSHQQRVKNDLKTSVKNTSVMNLTYRTMDTSNVPNTETLSTLPPRAADGISAQQMMSPFVFARQLHRCDLCAAKIEDGSCATTNCCHMYHPKCLESYVLQLTQRRVTNLRCPACMVPLSVILPSAVYSNGQLQTSVVDSTPTTPFNYKTRSPVSAIPPVPLHLSSLFLFVPA